MNKMVWVINIIPLNIDIFKIIVAPIYNVNVNYDNTNWIIIGILCQNVPYNFTYEEFEMYTMYTNTVV